MIKRVISFCAHFDQPYIGAAVSGKSRVFNKRGVPERRSPLFILSHYDAKMDIL